MHSKNKPAMTAAERDHVDRIKQMPCAVCEQPGPSDAHELEQGRWFLSVPLCRDCHQGGFNGIHGEKRIWKARKLDELAVLNNTIRALYA